MSRLLSEIPMFVFTKTSTIFNTILFIISKQTSKKKIIKKFWFDQKIFKKPPDRRILLWHFPKRLADTYLERFRPYWNSDHGGGRKNLVESSFWRPVFLWLICRLSSLYLFPFSFKDHIFFMYADQKKGRRILLRPTVLSLLLPVSKLTLLTFKQYIF